jgi:hypothetical protein
MNTFTVTVANRIPTEPYYHYASYLNSLARFGVVPEVVGLGRQWLGLMTKPVRFRNWLRDQHFEEQDRVIYTDSWDVLFAASPDSIAAKCAELFGDAVVYCTEKSCWPLAELAHHFPDEGTPWRYLNGGAMCGPAWKLRTMFESMNLEQYGFDREDLDKPRIEPNDAVPLVKAFVEQPVLVKVDARCQVFQCFSECSADEFEITEAGVKNKLTGTVPGILHFNGGSKESLMPAVLAAMNL